MNYLVPKSSNLSRWFWSVVLFLLSSWDGFATWVGLQSGDYYEINPLMRAAAEHSPTTFFLLKTGLMLLAVLIIFKAWNKRIEARYICFFAIGLYTCVGILHAASFVMLGIPVNL